MKRSVLFFFALMLAITSASAQFRSNVNQRPPQQRNQRSDSKFDWSKIYFGGGGSFGFGTGYNYFSLFPIAGYRITDNFSVGTGITYDRYTFKYTYKYTLTQYGVTPFLRYNIQPVFFQTEYDLINSPITTINGETERSNFSRFLVGIGYMSQIGSGRSAFNILAMYDLLYKTPSVFQSPVVLRVFVTF